MINYTVRSTKSIDRMTDSELLLELLKMRGVEDPQALLDIDARRASQQWDAYSFKNMNEGLDLLYKHLEQTPNSHIHLLVDVDVDGCSSSALYYLWHTHRYPNVPITFDSNEGKKHGLNEDIMARLPEGTTLLITPDSSSSDVEWHEKFAEMGVDILVLDHHEFDVEQETPAVIINCMDGEYPNQSLTGVGVTFKFLQQYDLDLEIEPYVEQLMDLVALGQIADLSDVRDLETRYLCIEGMQNFGRDNLFLQAIMKEQEYSMKGVANFVTIGWYVSPIMNAIFRQGSLEDRYDLFKAICNFEEERIHYPARKTKDNPDKLPIVESLQKNIIRRAKSIKSHQDNEVKKEVKEIKKRIEEECPLDENPVIILDVTDKIGLGHGGLIANKLANEYMRPVLLVNDKGGSARNYSKFPIDDLNAWITSSGLASGSGHSNAFGLNFTDDEPNVEALRDWCKEKLAGVDTTPVWHVDFEFDMAKLRPKHILKVGQFETSFGGKNMDEALFAITNVVLETADVQRLGQSGTMMKFDIQQGDQKITFVRPFTGQDVYKEFICEDAKSRGLRTEGGAGNKKITATIIGKFKINEFNGKQYPQVEIVAFDTQVVAGRSRRQRGF